MAEIVSPGTLESFAEKQIKTLLEAQLTLVPDDNIMAGHCTDGENIDQEAPMVIVTVTRDEEDIPGSGWWACSISCEFDPRDLSDDDVDDAWLQIETALGDGGGDIETQITSGRLQCMTGSVFYGGQEYDPEDGERVRTYELTASLGLNAP